MKEIGGYFELEELDGEPFYLDLIPLNLGRTALLYMMEALGASKLVVPYFLCASVIDTCKNHGIELDYYHIDSSFRPIFDRDLEDGEYLYLVNFYGQLSDADVLSYQKEYGRIIADYTHSFFQRPLSNVPTLYSCRKYFGLPDGAYASLPEGCPLESLPEDTSSNRMTHILGRYEHSASDYYQNMLDTAHSFDQEPIKAMSRLTKNLLKGIPYDSVRKKRHENFAYLHSHLQEQNPLALTMPEGPFVYPFYHKEGMKLKKLLAEKKVFVPTYWSNVIAYMPEDSLEYDYAANILPLPVDQRYHQEDMQQILDTLFESIEELGSTL